MKKLTTLALFFTLLVSGWAENWGHKNNLWTNTGVSITVPTGFKASQDNSGNLTVENSRASVVLVPLKTSDSFESFRDAKIKEMNNKAIKWGKPATSKKGTANVTKIVGQLTDKEFTLQFSLSMISQGSARVGVVTVNSASDKMADGEIAKVLNATVLK